MSVAFTSGWVTAYPSYPIAYEDQKFDQPKQTPWVAFGIQLLPRQRMNIGSKRFIRAHGMVAVEFYVPEDSGSKTLFEMMDKALDILESGSFTVDASRTITTLAGTPVNLGKENAFYAGVVTVPMYLDEAI